MPYTPNQLECFSFEYKHCKSPKMLWLPRTYGVFVLFLCFQLDPESGPTEGGTVVTISGSNLGQRAEDIQSSVTVAGVPCIVIQSRYEVSSRQGVSTTQHTQLCICMFFLSYANSCVIVLCRIVCETTSSGREMRGHASVSVRGGGHGISAHTFSFQVSMTMLNVILFKWQRFRKVWY